MPRAIREGSTVENDEAGCLPEGEDVSHAQARVHPLLELPLVDAGPVRAHVVDVGCPVALELHGGVHTRDRRMLRVGPCQIGGGGEEEGAWVWCHLEDEPACVGIPPDQDKLPSLAHDLIDDRSVLQDLHGPLSTPPRHSHVSRKMKTEVE